MKTIHTIISRILSPLSFGEGQGVRLLLLLLLVSCSEQTELEQPVADGETVEVSKTLQVSVLPIQSIGSAATRAQEDKLVKGEAIHVSYTDDLSTRATTGTEDKTEEEAKINNAYMLQFGGTASTSVLKVVQSISAEQLAGSSPITCTLQMTAGVKNRVYVVANVPDTKTFTVDATTLADFEGVVTLAPTMALPTMGLPMSACQDIGVGDTFSIFQLKSVLARLTFKTSAGTLQLMNVPNGYTFSIQAQPGDKAVRPTGMTYTSTYEFDSDKTYYVPENLSGRNDLLIHPYTRALGMAPANSTYVQITNGSTIYSLLLGDGTPQDFNFTGGYSYNIKATIYGTDTYDLRVGNLLPAGTAVTDLSASGTANCYIATAANAWYTFNGTMMGNGATTPYAGANAAAIIPSRLNPQSADVLWETLNTTTAPTKGDVVSGNLYLLRDRILFKSGAQQGNAVVAARDASNNIIWSWHIWRINTDPTLPVNRVTATSYTSSAGIFDDTGTMTHPGFTMMKLNLGALSSTAGDDLSTGFYYQWGRKDPFPASAGLTAPNNVAMATVPVGIPVTSAVSVQYTVAQSIAQPTTFILYGGDWCSTRNDNLWGTPLTKTVYGSYYTSNHGSKSVYDPCPPGWRIPPAYVYVNATHENCPWLDPSNNTNNKGRDFKGIFSGTFVWFPASGYRSYSDGALGNVGVIGFYSVSTPFTSSPVFAHSSYFTSDYVNSYGGGHRADAYSCRCVLE